MQGRRAGTQAGREAAASLVILAALTAAGCGDALVPEPTYETPLLSFEADFAETYQTSDFDQTSIGIVWVDPLQLRDDLPQPASGMRVSPPSTSRKFTVDLFAPPPEAAIRRLPDPTTHDLAVAFAFGEIVLFKDGDGDGRFAISPRAFGSLVDPPDAYLGSTETRAVVYVETPAAPGSLGGTVWRTLTEPPGYRLVAVNCGSTPPTVTTLGADNHTFVMTVARMSSPELIVTRTCLSPTRPAVGQQP